MTQNIKYISLITLSLLASSSLLKAFDPLTASPEDLQKKIGKVKLKIESKRLSSEEIEARTTQLQILSALSDRKLSPEEALRDYRSNKAFRSTLHKFEKAFRVTHGNVLLFEGDLFEKVISNVVDMEHKKDRVRFIYKDQYGNHGDEGYSTDGTPVGILHDYCSGGASSQVPYSVEKSPLTSEFILNILEFKPTPLKNLFISKNGRTAFRVKEVFGTKGADVYLKKEETGWVSRDRDTERFEHEGVYFSNGTYEVCFTPSRYSSRWNSRKFLNPKIDVSTFVSNDPHYQEAMKKRCVYDLTKAPEAVIKTIERGMRPKALSEVGFLRPEQRLLDVIAQDREIIASYGLTPQELVEPLLKVEFLRGLLDRIFIFDKTYYYISFVTAHGGQVFPFGSIQKEDDFFENQGDTMVTLHRLGEPEEDNRRPIIATIKYESMVPVMLYKWGFLEGPGLPYRLEPIDIVEMFFPSKMKEAGK